jgi:uncharacterized protein (DUF1778 family)
MDSLLRRSELIQIRVTPNEKIALGALARSQGVSLSEFVVSAAKDSGLRAAKSLDEATKVRTLTQRRAPYRARRTLKGRPVEPFKVPYLQARDAATFEEVVRYVAREMHTDEHTVAILMTHLVEGIADVVVSGRVFRWPGFFAVGSVRVQTKEGDQCRPRFQAYPPMTKHVLWNCSMERACNKEMQAHRRRRRKDRFGTLRSMMESMRYTIAKQDLKILDAMLRLNSDWRDFAPTHEL